MTVLIIMSTVKNIDSTFNDLGHFPARISELISNPPMFNFYFGSFPTSKISLARYLWPISVGLIIMSTTVYFNTVSQK